MHQVPTTFLKFLIPHLYIDQATITFLQTDLTVSEEDDTELVCVGINGVPPGGLGCDIIVDFNLTSSPSSVARKQKFFLSYEILYASN